MIKKQKKDNNLICITIGNKEKRYFTSTNKASYYVGVAPCSIKWAIDHHSVSKTGDGKDIVIELVDGSEVQYKYINNLQ